MSDTAPCRDAPGLLPYAEIRAKVLSRFDAEASAAYTEWVRWMAEVGTGAGALRVGDTAPEFLLPDVDGRLVSSASLLERGPMILTFIRGSWCPFCSVELLAYEDRMSQIHALGGQVVAITPDTGDYPRAMKRGLGLEEVTMLSDIDYGLGLSYGLVYAVPQVGRQVLAGRGIDLPKRHGSSLWILPVPATYLVTRDGTIAHAFVEPDFTKREEPEVMIGRLRGALQSPCF
jgi:peroxiredoxin